MSQDIRHSIESIGEDFPGRVTRPTACRRTCFSELLEAGMADIRYAYDGAYRQPETLSLAQRSEYGLRNHSTLAAQSSNLPHVNVKCGGCANAEPVRGATGFEPTAPSRRATVPILLPTSLTACVAQRYASTDVRRLAAAKQVNDRKFSGRRPAHHCLQYRSFTARAGEYAIRCVVFRGRSFAAGTTWTR
jgi:hypothetical protein